MPKQKAVSQTHATNSDIVLVSSQFHQHRLLAEIDTSQLDIKPAHLFVVALVLNRNELFSMVTDAIPGNSIFVFVLEDWVKQTAKLYYSVLSLRCDCRG